MSLASKVTIRSFLVPALILRSARSRSAEVVDASSRPIPQGSPKGLWVCSGTCFQCNAPRGTGDFILARNARGQTRVPAKRSAYHFVITFAISAPLTPLVLGARSRRWRSPLALRPRPRRRPVSSFRHAQALGLPLQRGAEQGATGSPARVCPAFAGGRSARVPSIIRRFPPRCRACRRVRVLERGIVRVHSGSDATLRGRAPRAIQLAFARIVTLRCASTDWCRAPP
jgi:hypothetical protein